MAASQPDDQVKAQQALYGQVAVGPDGSRLDTGVTPEFGAFMMQTVVYAVPRHAETPTVSAPPGFRDVTAEYENSLAVRDRGMFAILSGRLENTTCSVSAFPAERLLGPSLLDRLRFDATTHRAVAVQLHC